jgi:hypothetical protein
LNEHGPAVNTNALAVDRKRGLIFAAHADCILVFPIPLEDKASRFEPLRTIKCPGVVESLFHSLDSECPGVVFSCLDINFKDRKEQKSGVGLKRLVFQMKAQERPDFCLLLDSIFSPRFFLPSVKNPIPVICFQELKITSS